MTMGYGPPKFPICGEKINIDGRIVHFCKFLLHSNSMTISFRILIEK